MSAVSHERSEDTRSRVAEPADSRAIPEPATASPAPAPPVATLAELVSLDLRARVGKYQATGAVWVTKQAVVVNRDFDFQSALLGAAESAPQVAAARRLSDNSALAHRLAALTPMTPDALLDRLMLICDGRCEALDGATKVRIYGFLFGDQSARLRVVVEVVRGDASMQYVAVGGPRASEAFASPELYAEFDAGLVRIADLLRERTGSAPTRSRLLCPIGGNELVLGDALEESSGQVVLSVSSEEVAALLSCPLDSARAPRVVPERPASNSSGQSAAR